MKKQLTIQTLPQTMNLFIAFFITFVLYGAFTLIFSQATHAASLTVNTDTHPSACTLDEAIENINDGAQTNTDCVETGSYGTNDTINLPSGMILLTANLPELTKSVTVTGAGMGKTIVDGNSQWLTFTNDGSTGKLDLAFSGITFKRVVGGAILIYNSNITVKKVEVDGVDSTDVGQLGGIAVLNNSGDETNLLIEDIYVHDFTTSTDNSILMGIGVALTDDSTMNVQVKRTTVTRLENNGGADTQVYGIGFMSGQFGGTAFSPATINGDLDNVTVSDLRNSANTGTTGVGVSNILKTGSVDSTNVGVNIKNSTIRSVVAPEHGLFPDQHGLLIVNASAAGDPGATVNSTINLTNTVLAGAGTDPYENCGVQNFSALFGGTGTVALSLSSHGGNLSDDNSCKDYFTKSTDQNNVSALADTLAPLSDNGGYVPTMALKQGSPAIDAGVTVPGLTTDARLAARPQGTAYDSGAYESPYTKTTETGESLAGTGESVRTIALVGGFIVVIGAALHLVRKRFA